MSRAIVFGKLPAHGDFVARGLAAGERDALDDWLSRSIAAARAAMGEAFEPSYDVAPPWRVAWRDGDGWCAGAMAPSVDAVGRRYPILAARDGLGDSEALAFAEAAEQAIYAALGEGWDVDRLAAAVAALAPDPDEGDGGGEPREEWWTLGGGIDDDWAFFEDRVPGARPPGLIRAVLTMRPLAGQERVA